MVLPLVLSGLTTVYLRHTVDIEFLGEYVRDQLWPALQRLYAHASASEAGPLPSWDGWIQERRVQLKRRSAYGALGLLPPFFIFGMPSFGALVIARQQATSFPLALVWWLDVIAAVVSTMLTGWASTEAPGWKKARSGLGSDSSGTDGGHGDR